MTVAISQIDTNTDNFLDLASKTNQALAAISNKAVTVASNSAVGHAGINGSLTANALYTTTLYGGAQSGVTALSIASNTTFTSNVSFTGSNNSFGTVSNIHATGANSTHKMVMANNSTGKFLFTSLLAEILLVDGANSAVDSDLLDGQHGAYYADIAARQGYTSANKAGDTFTSNVAISNTAPALSLISGTGSVVLQNFSDNLKITGTNTISMPSATMVSNTVPIVSTAATIVHQFSKTSFRSGKYIASVTNGNANAHTASEMLVIHNVDNAFLTTYAVLHTNTVFGQFSANTDAANVRVFFTSTSNSASVKFDSILLNA